MFTSSRLSHASVKPREQPPSSMLSVHWWGCIRNKWLCSVLFQRNKTLNLVSCSIHKKFLRSHQDVQLLTDNSSLVYLCVYLFSKSPITLILRKKMTFCKLQKIFDGWNTLCSCFQPGGAVALSCHSQNRCCKSIPWWVYSGSTLVRQHSPSEETSEVLCACLHLYECSKRMMKVHCVLLLLISSGKVFQPLPWRGVVSSQSMWDHGFAYTSAWVSVCSRSSLSCW